MVIFSFTSETFHCFFLKVSKLINLIFKIIIVKLLKIRLIIIKNLLIKLIFKMGIFIGGVVLEKL